MTACTSPTTFPRLHASTPPRLHACTKVVEDRDAILRRLTSERAEREEKGERGERATLPSQATSTVAAVQEEVGSGSGTTCTARSTYEQKRSAWAHRVSKVPHHPTPPHTTPPPQTTPDHTTPPQTTSPSHPIIPPPNTTSPPATHRPVSQSSSVNWYNRGSGSMASSNSCRKSRPSAGSGQWRRREAGHYTFKKWCTTVVPPHSVKNEK